MSEKPDDSTAIYITLPKSDARNLNAEEFARTTAGTCADCQCDVVYDRQNFVKRETHAMGIGHDHMILVCRPCGLARMEKMEGFTTIFPHIPGTPGVG